MTRQRQESAANGNHPSKKKAKKTKKAAEPERLLARKLFSPAKPRAPPQASDVDDAIAIQVQLYRKSDWRQEEGDHWTACDYWRENAEKYPRIADLARRRLCTQASSATSERSFSKAGLICVKNRLSLLSQNVDCLSAVGWDVMHRTEGRVD